MGIYVHSEYETAIIEYIFRRQNLLPIVPTSASVLLDCRKSRLKQKFAYRMSCGLRPKSGAKRMFCVYKMSVLDILLRNESENSSEFESVDKSTLTIDQNA